MNTPEKIATCTYFIRDGQVLLPWQVDKIVGRKGYGGKIESWQTIRSNVFDEVIQESGGKKEFRLRPDEEGGIIVKEEDLQPIAMIDFYNGEDVPFGEPSFRVYFFLCERFEGIPLETKEMIDPKWYDLDNVPLKELVKGDEDFIMPLLNGIPSSGHIRRSKDWSKVLENTVAPCAPESLDF